MPVSKWTHLTSRSSHGGKASVAARAARARVDELPYVAALALRLQLANAKIAKEETWKNKKRARPHVPSSPLATTFSVSSLCHLKMSAKFSALHLYSHSCSTSESEWIIQSGRAR
jgi:hypothetical protein